VKRSAASAVEDEMDVECPGNIGARMKRAPRSPGFRNWFRSELLEVVLEAAS
jgi:hypothetical protein